MYISCFPRSVYFVTPDNGWMVGRYTLYHYDGYSWTDYSYTLPTGYNLNEICFPDEGNGWIVGYSGTILYCKNPSTIQTEISDITYPIVYSEVYPNPCESKCVIVVPNKGHEILSLKIFNISGQELKVSYATESSNDKSKIELDVSLLEPGIYFLSVQTGNEKITRKIIRK